MSPHPTLPFGPSKAPASPVDLPAGRNIRRLEPWTLTDSRQLLLGLRQLFCPEGNGTHGLDRLPIVHPAARAANDSPTERFAPICLVFSLLEPKRRLPDPSRALVVQGYNDQVTDELPRPSRWESLSTPNYGVGSRPMKAAVTRGPYRRSSGNPCSYGTRSFRPRYR